MERNASEEQILYANIMNIGMLIGLGSLVITFIIYTTGLLSPFIPLMEVEKYWVLPVSEYLVKSGTPAGWEWLSNLQFGDMLNFLPIALLSLLTIVCYISIIPMLIKKKDTAYVVLAFLEIIVLAVAASGILGTAGH